MGYFKQNKTLAHNIKTSKFNYIISLVQIIWLFFHDKKSVAQ